MSEETSPEATAWLQSAAAGNRECVDRLLPLIYDQLRKLAERHMTNEKDEHTLSPTILVHEAYVKLIDHERIDWQSRSHFLALASTTMRRFLVDHARTKRRLKRGGDRQKVEFEEMICLVRDEPLSILDLEGAMSKLAEKNARQAKVVELRVYGGLNIDEAAEVLGVSPRTIDGDWAIARAWLRRELAKEE